MPPLPATRKERREADLERKVDRLQRDVRHQWLRSRRARRALVVLCSVLCILIFPGFALWGSIPGILVTAAAGGAWWVLGVSIRTVADLPDRFLDERQRLLRDRAYRDAYKIYVLIIVGLGSCGLGYFAARSQDDALAMTLQWNQVFGLVMFAIVLATMLPSMALAWRDAEEPDA